MTDVRGRARGERARREPEAKSQRTALRGILLLPAAAQAVVLLEALGIISRQHRGGRDAAAPAVLRSASRTYDSARPAALRHRTEWRKKPRGPYDEWRTRAAAPLPSLVATVMHFIRARWTPTPPFYSQALPCRTQVRGGGPTIRTIVTTRARARRGGLRVDGRRELLPDPEFARTASSSAW